MTEMIIIHPGTRRVDEDGHRLPPGPDRTISVKSLQRVQESELSDDDRAGNVQVVRVWCTSGEEPSARDDVTIRGTRFQVRVPSWDSGLHRSPALSRHRPSVVFEAVRGEG